MVSHEKVGLKLAQAAAAFTILFLKLLHTIKIFFAVFPCLAASEAINFANNGVETVMVSSMYRTPDEMRSHCQASLVLQVQ